MAQQRLYRTSGNAKTRDQKTKERKLKILNWIQRQIAELLFAQILDEDYWMGIRHGRISGLKADILYLENVQKGENKTNAKGLQVAIDALRKMDK
jgi:hypothetical protein